MNHGGERGLVASLVFKTSGLLHRERWVRFPSTSAKGTKVARLGRVNCVHGTITLVQEGRFQLACDDGRSRLFVLSHKAPMEGDELLALQREGARVEVDYDDDAHIVAHTAHRISKEVTHDESRH